MTPDGKSALSWKGRLFFLAPQLAAFISHVGTNRTSSDVLSSVAIGCKPDMARTAHSVEIDHP